MTSDAARPKCLAPPRGVWHRPGGRRSYLRNAQADLIREGYEVDVKLNDRKVVHSSFVRFPGLVFELGLSPLFRIGAPRRFPHRGWKPPESPRRRSSPWMKASRDSSAVVLIVEQGRSKTRRSSAQR